MTNAILLVILSQLLYMEGQEQQGSVVAFGALAVATIVIVRGFL